MNRTNRTTSTNLKAMFYSFLSNLRTRLPGSKIAGYLLAVIAIAVVSLIAVAVQNNDPTVIALVLLVVVLLIATGWGSRPALLATGLGVLSFDLIQRQYNEIGATSRDWYVLIALLITAVTAGQLSAYAKKRTKEAMAGRREVEQLYSELRDSFERANQAEAARRSEQLKSSLLDAVTHNLRTPLTSIKAVATTLHTELNEAPDNIDVQYWRELLEVTIEEANRLNSFVEGLVELAQIESGQLGLRRAWGSVDEIIETALASAEGLKPKQRFEVKVEDNLPPVNVDPSFMVEVIYAIVDNATKYSPAETTVTVSATRAPGEMIQFSIEDQGRGIPPEIREQVFEKFYRSPTTEAKEGGRPSGIGMGLAIAKGIVEAHGGTIRIEDDGSRGTRVVFVVPINNQPMSSPGENGSEV